MKSAKSLIGKGSLFLLSREGTPKAERFPQEDAGDVTHESRAQNLQVVGRTVEAVNNL